MVTEETRKATQAFIVLDVLAKHAGQNLTPDVVESIKAELSAEMQSGSCAWAFAREAR